jgi:hypothetical protein
MALSDRDLIRAAVAARYAGLARAAQAGETITDGDPDASAGCAAVLPVRQDGPQQASRLAMGITGGPVGQRSRRLRPGRVPGRAGARRRLRRIRR